MAGSNPPHKPHVSHVSQTARLAKKHSSGKKTSHPTLHRWFEAQAENTPDAVAISFGTKQLTYRELNEKANQLANYLRTMEVGPETLVGMFVDRSLELVVGILGILKAGGAYVPFDLAYPKDRLSFMFEDANIRVLLTQKKLLADLYDVDNEQPSLTLPKTICLDDDWGIISKESSGNPKSGATGQNLAYVIYTSGTTGKPKGVMVTHSNVVRLFESTEHWYHFGPSDVWTLFHSYAFDFSVWEIWGALLYGGRLVIVSYFMTRSPEAFLELLSREKVTVLNQTPSAFRQLIWADASAEIMRQLHLRYVIFGGEALDLQSLMPWFERRGDAHPQLINMYGITETTAHVTYRPIALRDVMEGVGSVIGEPIPDLQIYLLDKNLDPVADGSEGEIYVGGAGVGRGYLNRPDLTVERFIVNPFREATEDRLYKTGDLARRLPNGDMEYLGRLDHQIKIRGFRIELGEISSVLNCHPSVRESVVIADQMASGDARLIAYVVFDQTIPSTTELRDSLKQQLPYYMLPAAFIFLDKMPLTPNGKLDRHALPHPDGARPELKNTFFAPNKSEEKELAEIWSDVLQIKPVGIHDSFFELGGDSIRSIQVIARARQVGLNITLEQLFQEQTIYNLVQGLLKRTDRVYDAEPVQPFGMISSEDKRRLPDGLEDAYPAIQLQIGMLYHGELNPQAGLYHDIFSYCIEAPFHYDKLETAVGQLFERHAILRTSFDLDRYSEPLQLVKRRLETVPLAVEDIRDISPSEQDGVISAWIEEEKAKPFDYTVAPLLRFHIHWLCDQTFQLSYASHHAILDGWSLAAMLTELLQTYKHLLHPHKKTLVQPTPPPYRNYVTLEKETLQSDACREFWTKKLKNYRVLKLPRWPGVNRLGTNDELLIRYAPLSTAISDGLKQLANRVGVPLKSVLLAAHVFVMGYLSGQTDVLTGLVTNGRPEEIDAERTLGLFLNTVPFRVHLHGGTWKKLVKEMFEAEQELLPFRRYPLSEIQKNAGGESLFETPFLMVHFHVYKEILSENGIKFTEGPFFEYTNYPFFSFFSVDPVTQQAQLRFDLNAGEFCEQQIQELAGYYTKTLSAMVENPEGRYEIFSPLSDVEMHRLLYEWNDTHVDYPDCTLHELFEAQVKRTPDVVAVIFEQQQLTYRELNSRANQLAHYLRKQGVGPEVLVGICVERSLEMVIGLLGILKAGGGYVPLDPGNPQDRLAFMIEDAQIPVLLTQDNLGLQLPKVQNPQSPIPNINIVCQDADRDAISQQSDDNPVRLATSDNIAYVIYTSGSTGKPKGTMINHQSVVNYLCWCTNAYAVADGYGAPVNSSIGFDATITSLFSPLLVGARIVLLPDKQEIEALCAVLSSNINFSLIKITPAHLDILNKLLNPKKSKEQTRALIIGGEALHWRHLSFWESYAPETRIINEYGPTETVVGCCVYDAKGQKSQTGTVPIGRPIANIQLYILDSHLQPVPVGVPGELCIGGAGLARGYLNRPNLTAEKFIPNPFCKDPGSRMYKTGDQARYLPDGNIEFLGRIDHQVKVRGFRIELGEIEAVLNLHPEVQAAVSAVMEDLHGDKRLVAYVVSSSVEAPTDNDLRSFLKTKLPNYMVPSSFVMLDALPLTSNGKVDRLALPIQDNSQRSYEKEYVAPQTPTEKALATIWSEILDIDRIGIYDDFFELGGHSLLAIQVASRIRNTFNVTVSLRRLFESSTLAGLALEIDRNKTGKGQHDELTILFGEIENLPNEEAERLLLEEAKTGEEGP